MAWIDTLPGIKKQPNLVFAAARWHGVPAPGPYAGLRDALLADDGAIRATILARSTQTNEVGRLATLLPASPRWSGRRAGGAARGRGERGAEPVPRPVGLRWSTAEGAVRAGRERRAWPARSPAPAPLPADAAGRRLARRHRPQPARRHRRRRDGLAGEPGLARAGRPPRAAAARGRRWPGRPAAARAAATCSSELPGAGGRGRRRTAPWSCSTARSRPTSPCRTASRMQRADARAGRRGRLPLGEQRGAGRVPGRHRDGARPGRPPRPVRARRRRPGGRRARTATGRTSTGWLDLNIT